MVHSGGIKGGILHHLDAPAPQFGLRCASYLSSLLLLAPFRRSALQSTILPASAPRRFPCSVPSSTSVRLGLTLLAVLLPVQSKLTTILPSLYADQILSHFRSVTGICFNVDNTCCNGFYTTGFCPGPANVSVPSLYSPPALSSHYTTGPMLYHSPTLQGRKRILQQRRPRFVQPALHPRAVSWP